MGASFIQHSFNSPKSEKEENIETSIVKDIITKSITTHKNEVNSSASESSPKCELKLDVEEAGNDLDSHR
jgi:hypothetical protein